MIRAMNATKPTPDRRTPTNDEIPDLLEEVRTSGESIACFARRRGLSTWKLYQARRKLDKLRVAEPILDPIRLLDARGFATTIELETRRGQVVRVPAGFDAETLRRILELLESC
jgi:hypothetical protein